MKHNPSHILIVDDEQETIRVLLGVLAQRGIRGTVASDGPEALGMLEKHAVDLVFCTMRVERPREGLKLIESMKAVSPELPMIAMGRTDAASANAQMLVDVSVQSIHAGCRHFLLKPFAAHDVESLLERFLPNRSVAVADGGVSGCGTGHRIVGKSPKLMETVDLARRVAATTMPVLVSGESGTGKELIASLIHASSRRMQGPYMQVNCAALNDSLLESELFGHEKGAFTGAYTQRKGRFEMAHGGTLLLDEITETPIKFQATLLRVLEQQDFERVGGNDPVQVDVRIVSTTNKDLAQEAAAGRFRQDLYYRLCGIRLVVPPLRERIDDLPDLVWHFVNLYSRQTSRRITALSSEMMDLFAAYPWPGNIRQLRNVVRTCLTLGSGSTLSLADASWLFDDLQPRLQTDSAGGGEDAGSMNLSGLPLADVERQAILDTLERTSGNQTKAARILGISDRTLRVKIRQYRQQDCMQLA